VLLPALRRSGADLVAVTSRGGASATTAARLFGIRAVAADAQAILQDAAIDTVFILTRHDSHARLAAEALRAGKHVFVEKPLAIRAEELIDVGLAYRVAGRHMMVGYNRRFARHIEKARALLHGRSGPASLVMTVNAGALPADHWIHDPQEGGGRLLGEGVHWIDLFVSLVGRRVAQVVCTPAGVGVDREDTFTLTLAFEDGSIATLHYFASGSRSFPKERLDVFFDGQVLQLDNFRVLRGHGTRRFTRLRTWRQDKGHEALIAAFLRTVEHGSAPVVPFEELEHGAWVSLAAVLSARTGGPVAVGRFAAQGERTDITAVGANGRREEAGP
jgi:predicted dehydrogenase